MKYYFSLLFILTVNSLFSQDTIIWTQNCVPTMGQIVIADNEHIPTKKDFLNMLIGTWVFESYTTPCGNPAGKQDDNIDTLILTSDNTFTEIDSGYINIGKYKLTVDFVELNKNNKENKTLITLCGNLDNIKKYTLIDLTLNYFNKWNPKRYSNPQPIALLTESKLSFLHNVFVPNMNPNWKSYYINYRKIN